MCADVESNPYPLARPEDLEETRQCRGLDRRCITKIADVRDGAAMEAAAAEALEAFGQIDIALGNAGIMPIRPPGRPTEQEWRDCLDINLIGVWQTTRVVIPS